MSDVAAEGQGIAVGGRTPPHNLDAERSVLGAVLLKPSAFDEVISAPLGVDDFYLPAHREIYDAMCALNRRQQPIDLIALGDELKTRGMLGRLEGGEAYLITLASSVPTAENVGHYVRLVREKATLRRLISACVEIQSRSFADFGEFEEFLDEAERIVFNVAQQNRRENYRSAGEMMPDVLDGIEVRSHERKAITGVATGFKWLDDVTAGFQRENLVVVAARPGGGKTSWSVNVAMNAAMGANVPTLLFSLEMSKFELMERMLAGEARIDSARIRKGFLTYDDWKKIQRAGVSLAKAPICIDDSSALSIMEIRAKARRFRADPKYFPAQPPREDGKVPPPPLGLIVVDYLQLARGGGGARREESRQQEIAEISRGLKALAKDLKIPIIAISQLNREVEKREGGKPKLSDLRESGAIEQDADLIIFIHREDTMNPETGERGGNVAELIVGKHRNGATGSCKMTFIREYTRFENYVDEPEQY